MRLIDADTVKINYIGGFKDTFEVDYNSFMNAPIVDVVRCGECAKRMTDECPMCNECNLVKVPTDDNDFCSYGERRKP